jgi:hypothetical protein
MQHFEFYGFLASCFKIRRHYVSGYTAGIWLSDLSMICLTLFSPRPMRSAKLDAQKGKLTRTSGYIVNHSEIKLAIPMSQHSKYQQLTPEKKEKRTGLGLSRLQAVNSRILNRMVHESRGTGVVLPCIVKPWSQLNPCKLKALPYRFKKERKRKQDCIFL